MPLCAVVVAPVVLVFGLIPVSTVPAYVPKLPGVSGPFALWIVRVTPLKPVVWYCSVQDSQATCRLSPVFGFPAMTGVLPDARKAKGDGAVCVDLNSGLG